MKIEGIDFGPGADLQDVIRRRMAGQIHVTDDPHDPTLHAWLGRAYQRLRSAGEHEPLGQAFAALIADDSGGRAMASGAAHLVDRVLPDVAIRQWVLSVPWPRRYLFAARPEMCAGVRRRVWRELSRWYERRAAALGEPGGSTGAVVVVQRFGSALNLNIHFHMLLLDGVFVEDGDAVRWVRVPPPTTEEVQQLVTDLSQTVERWLDTEGYGSEDVCDEDDDDANGVLLSASVAGRVALGARAGAKVRRLQRAQARRFRLPPLCGEGQGYNLHAAVVIRQGHRDGLERLCRYVLRPPLARTRLHRRADGLLVLTLRKPYANGTTDFLFSEVELAQKLAALVPPARKNGVSYHGVLAPRHRLRSQVIPDPPAEEEPRGRLTKNPAPGRSRWHAWADLLWRVFAVDRLGVPWGHRSLRARHGIIRPPLHRSPHGVAPTSGVPREHERGRFPRGARLLQRGRLRAARRGRGRAGHRGVRRQDPLRPERSARRPGARPLLPHGDRAPPA